MISPEKLGNLVGIGFLIFTGYVVNFGCATLASFLCCTLLKVEWQWQYALVLFLLKLYFNFQIKLNSKE